MKKRLLAVVLSVCLLLPTLGLQFGQAVSAAEAASDDWVLFDTNYSINKTYTIGSGGSFGMGDTSRTFDSFDATKYGGIDKVGLSIDYFVSSESSELLTLFENEGMENGTRQFEGQIELRTKTIDNESGEAYADPVKLDWKANEWGTAVIPLSEFGKASGVDWTDVKYLRIYMNGFKSDSKYIGKSATFKFMKVRFVNLEKTRPADDLLGDTVKPSAGEYVIKDIGLNYNQKHTMSSSGSLLVTDANTVFTAVNVQEYGLENVALSMDVFVSGDKGITDALKAQKHGGEIELCSGGAMDNQEANLPLKDIQWKVGEWNRVTIPLSKYTNGNQKYGTVDFTKINYFRIFLNGFDVSEATGNPDLVGQEVTLKFAKVRLVDTRNAAPSLEDDPLGNTRNVKSVAGYEAVSSELPLKATGNYTVPSSSSDLLVVGGDFSDIDLSKLGYTDDANNKIGIQLDIYMDCEDEELRDFLETGSGFGGQLEITGSGKADWAELNANATKLQFKNGQWIRQVLPLNEFTKFNSQNNPDKTGFNGTANYIRLYMNGFNKLAYGQSLTLKICNVKFVDLSKSLTEETRGQLGDGSFKAAAPEFKLVKMGEGYNNDEPIVAGYNYAEYVAAHPEVKDLDPATIIQSLMDTLGSYYNGGTVFLPAGNYKLGASLIIPKGVTLCGEWAAPDGKSAIKGTILEVTDTDTYAVTMSAASVVRNVAFWYPEQDAADPVEYPATIIAGSHTTIKNVTMVNPTVGVYTTGGNCNAHITNMYGTPLSIGVELNGLVDMTRLANLNFAADYWANSGLENAPASDTAKAVLAKYLYDLGTGVMLRRMDWSYVNFSHIRGYNVGIMMHGTTSGSGTSKTYVWSNGQCYGNEIEDCSTGIFVYGNGNQMITNNTIKNCEYGIWATNGAYLDNGSTDSPIQVIDSDIEGTKSAVRNESHYELSLNQTTLRGGAVTSNFGWYTITDSVFMMDGPQVVLENGTISAIFQGNKDAEGKAITVDNKGGCPVEFENSSTGMPETATLTEAEAAEQVKAAAKADLFVVEITDAKADITDALKAALKKAQDNGGGIVYLPGGNYIMNGEVTIPSGVELIGALNAGIGTPYNIATVLSVTRTLGTGEKATDHPSIILEKNAGIRGITFDYPDQFNDNVVKQYPYAIQGRGENVYVINVAFHSASNGVDLATYQCDNHYVSYLSGGCMENGIQVGGGSKNGVVRDCHFNFQSDVWPTQYGWAARTGISTENYEKNVRRYRVDNYTAYRIGDSENELIYNCMVYGAKYALSFEEMNGKASKNTRVFCQSIDWGWHSINVQAGDGIDIVNTQVTAFARSEAGQDLKDLKQDMHHVVLGKDFTGTVNMAGVVAYASPSVFASVENGTLNVNSVYLHRTNGPMTEVSEKGKININDVFIRETYTNLPAVQEGSTAANLKVTNGYYINKPVGADSIGEFSRMLEAIARWDTPTNAVIDKNSDVVMVEGFTGMKEFSSNYVAQGSDSNATVTVQSGTVRMFLNSNASAALLDVKDLDLAAGKSNSLYRIETRLNLNALRDTDDSKFSLILGSAELFQELVSVNAAGEVKVGGKVIGTIETEEWYRLAIEVDMRDASKRTYKVYLLDGDYKTLFESEVVSLISALQGDEVVMNFMRFAVSAETETNADTYTMAILDYLFVTRSESSTFGLLGDVDGDGEVTSTDARLALQYYARKISAEKLNISMGDVDGDGEVTSTDARLILQRYVGKISKFPVE